MAVRTVWQFGGMGRVINEKPPPLGFVPPPGGDSSSSPWAAVWFPFPQTFSLKLQ